MKTKLLALGAAVLMIQAVPVLAGSHEGGDGHHGDKHGKKMGKMFEKMDADGDGKISKEEFVDGHAMHFDNMDADGDGYLTKDEKKAAWEGKKEKMKEHKEKMMEKKDGMMDNHHE